ncbi:MAG: XRE family transcriptional regulator [Rhodobacter sp.]|nr:XRE family transcriptional regulator [Rhodobacter sp.]
MTDASESTPPLDAAALQEAAISAAVAGRIAELRRARGFSFDALAQRAGVSKGTLVQIEQQRANPSISTLCRLAVALDVSVADLVSPPGIGPQAVTVVREAEARRLWTGPKGGAAVLLAGTPGPDMLEIWSWLLMPEERFEAAVHGRGTRELLHVTQGRLALEVEGHMHLIAAGCCAIALTDRPHAYANPGKVPVRFTMTVHEPAKD